MTNSDDAGLNEAALTNLRLVAKRARVVAG
jgi:hypothetical protein